MMVNTVYCCCRRKMIVSCEQLTYLDTRPVTPKDRLCTEAWRDGGIEAERKMRQEIAMEQQKKQEEDIRKLIKYVKIHFIYD